MALFQLQQYGKDPETEESTPTFKECAIDDITSTFFEESEFAEWHKVDGKECLVVIITDDVRQHSAHWEAGAKQNFDTGLYDSYAILYIRMEDYGPKPKIGKLIVLDEGTDHKRTYAITNCEEELGVFRMTIKRIRQ
jgi:hypothetical protein